MTDSNYVGYDVKTTNTGMKNSAISLAIGAGIAGAGVGAVCGALKQVPVINANGVANDSFIKTVYKNHLKKTTDEELKLFEKQRLNFMRNIKNVKTPDEFRKLITTNEKLVDNVLATSNKNTEDFAHGINRFTMRIKKRNITKKVENAYESRLNDISGRISECWNETCRRFEKSGDVSDELYKAIRKSKNALKAKQAGKTALTTGLVTCAGTFLIAKIVDIVKNNRNKKQATDKNLNIIR